MAEVSKFATDDLRICQMMKSLGYIPSVIYDIGGSNGSWTRTIQTVYPDTYYELFEPQAHHNPHYDQYLIPLVEAASNIRLHTNLLANFDGSAELQIAGRHGVGSTMLELKQQKFPAGERMRVRTCQLDSMIETGNLRSPDLIKMDIQGAELLALQGGIRRALPVASVLALELWLVRDYGQQTPLLGEVSHFLEQYDYYPFDFGEAYRDPITNLLIAQDVWYCRLGSSLAKILWKNRLTAATKAS